MKSKKKEPSANLTEEEVKKVWDFYQFARSMQGNSYPSMMTPQLLNQRMQDISLNPQLAEQDKLDSALKDPKNNEEYLQGISHNFEVVSSVYKRLIEYLSTMLSFDLTYTCINADKDDYGTVAFKKSERKLEEFMDRFDYVQNFQTAVQQMIRSDAFFCSPRFDYDKYVLQELPTGTNWTKITGRWPYGLLFSLNMYWFVQPGVEIDMYLPFFGKAYQHIWGGKKQKDYIPTLAPSARGFSAWVYWQDVPPEAGHVFKMTPELATRLPHYVGLFSDLILQPLMRGLQKNISMAEATKILTGEIPFLNNSQAKVADQLSMTPETLGKFLGLVQSALSSVTRMVAAPLENIESQNFDGNNDMYPSYLRNMLAASGVNTGLIFTNAQRPNILESKLSLESDEMMMKKLYPQFESFLDYHVNQQTGKYKFAFTFEGTGFSTDRENRFNAQKDLMDRGIILPKKISAAIGMKYSDFKRMMDEPDSDEFIKKLKPIIQSAQMSKGDGGRPSESDSKIGDSGAQSREQGSNISKTSK